MSYLLCTCLASSVAAPAQALTIGIDLGPKGLYEDWIGDNTPAIWRAVPIAELSGLAVDGQSLSLVLDFEGDSAIRFFTATKNGHFNLSLTLSGTVAENRVLSYPSTGFLLDKNLDLISPPDTTGMAYFRNVGSLQVPFRMVSSDSFNRPIDIGGIMCDLELPDTEFTVTAASLGFYRQTRGGFGIGVDDGSGGLVPDIVPEAGRSLTMLSLGALTLLGVAGVLRGTPA